MDIRIKWNSIFWGDPLSAQNGDLLKNAAIGEFCNKIAKKQWEAGYFKGRTTLIYNTFFFTGILHFLGGKPSEKTVEFVKALETGPGGASETPSQHPWTDKTFLALKMFKWIGIEPKEKKLMYEFFRSMQNEDGGFGSISLENSNPLDTIWTLNILRDLSSLPNKPSAAESWMRENIQREHPFWIYHYLDLMQFLGATLEDSEIQQLKSKLKVDAEIDKNTQFENKYYRNSCLKLLGETSKTEPDSVPSPSYISSLLGDNPSEAYYATLLSEGRVNAGNRQKIIEKALAFESPWGGFLLPQESYVIKNSFSAHALFLTGKTFDLKKFILWIKNISNDDGWGSTPHSPTYCEYSSTVLTAIKLLGEDPVALKNKDGLVKKIEQEQVQLSQKTGNYNFLRTAKNIIEQMMLLGIEPTGYDQFDQKRYRNKDGGYGHPTHSYIYATFWAVRRDYLISKYFPAYEWSYAEKYKTAKWIESCYNKDGGFGTMPKHPSNIQATFLAVYALNMLGFYPSDYDRTFEWATKHMENAETSEDLLNSLYLVGITALLNEVKQREKIHFTVPETEKLTFEKEKRYVLYPKIYYPTAKEAEEMRLFFNSKKIEQIDYITTILPRCIMHNKKKQGILDWSKTGWAYCNACIYTLRGFCDGAA